MKTADQIRAEMDAEEPGLDWEAEGSSGWETVVELHRRTVLDTLETAALAVEQYAQLDIGQPATKMQEMLALHLRKMKPSST